MQTHQASHRHDWTSAEYVEDWLERDAARMPQHQALFALIASLLPFGHADPFRFVDIGTGNGALAATVLDAYPRSTAVGLDVSDTMLARARQELRRFGERVSLVQSDLADPHWWKPLAGEHVDAAVSSRAIHNVFNRRIVQRVYRQIADALPNGGVLVNADYVGPQAPLAARFGAAVAARAARTGDRRERLAHGHSHDHIHQGHRAEGHADDSAQEAGMHFAGNLEDHLRWLRRAGFSAVDCPWRELFLTVLVAQK